MPVTPLVPGTKSSPTAAHAALLPCLPTMSSSTRRLSTPPQVGKPITTQYLAAALHVFGNDSFRYVREVVGEHDAVLEFMVEIEGISVNGVDMIKWNDAGQIVEFKVMLRPLKAVNLIHQKMAAMLA